MVNNKQTDREMLSDSYNRKQKTLNLQISYMAAHAVPNEAAILIAFYQN